MALLAFTLLLLVLPQVLRIGLPRNSEISGPVRVFWWLDQLYCVLWHRLELPTGRAPLPLEGPALLISNHTSGIDSLVLQAACERRLGFMIIQSWYDHWLVHPICRMLGCIPVRHDGRDLGATRAALRALDDGRVVPIFPEGRIIPASGREFGEGEPGAAFLALRARAPVVPAYISGTPPSRDIMRSWITPSHSRVVFGPPLDLSPYRGNGDRVDKDRIGEVTELLMGSIRSLSAAYPPTADPAVPLHDETSEHAS